MSINRAGCCETCTHYKSNYESGWEGNQKYSREAGRGRCFARGNGSNDFKSVTEKCSETEGGVPLYRARLSVRLRELLGFETPVNTYF